MSAVGVLHLVSACETVPNGRLSPTYVALCGELANTAELEGPECPNECECELDCAPGIVQVAR